MSSVYVSIKEDVLKKLEVNLPEIRERFGIETIGIFGSVARGEDTPESDVDVLYRFYPNRIDYFAFLDLADYLKDLFGRKVDLVSLDDLRPLFRKYAEPDMIFPGCSKGEA